MKDGRAWMKTLNASSDKLNLAMSLAILYLFVIDIVTLLSYILFSKQLSLLFSQVQADSLKCSAV